MRTIWSMTLLLAAFGCSDMSDDPKRPSDNPTPIKIETPEGNVVVNKSTVDPTPQKVTAVTGNELKRLQFLGTQGPDFVASYLPNATEPDLKDYDRAFRAWQISETKQHSNEQVIEILGGYLGNKCIADLGMKWVTVTDEYGTDYAVRSTTVEVMAFPFSTVMKRIEDNEYDFIHGVYHAIKHTLASGDYKERDDKSSNE